MGEEEVKEKKDKKGNKEKVFLSIILFVLAYVFVFKPLVVSHCQKQAQTIEYTTTRWLGNDPETPIGTIVDSEKYKNCIGTIDPLHQVKVFLIGDN